MLTWKEVCAFKLTVQVVPDCFRLTDGNIELSSMHKCRPKNGKSPKDKTDATLISIKTWLLHLYATVTLGLNVWMKFEMECQMAQKLSGISKFLGKRQPPEVDQNFQNKLFENVRSIWFCTRISGEFSPMDHAQGQLVFSGSHQQLGNSADRILFPKIFCGLNFQLKDPSKSICIMRRSIRKFNIPPPGNPPGIWTFEDWLVQIPSPRGKKAIQMPQQFLLKYLSSKTNFVFNETLNTLFRERYAVMTPSNYF